MLLLTIIGICVIIAGFIFLSGEKNIQAVNNALTSLFSRSVISLDSFFLKNRVGTGISLVLFGLLFCFIAYYIKVKGGISLVRLFAS